MAAWRLVAIVAVSTMSLSMTVPPADPRGEGVTRVAVKERAGGTTVADMTLREKVGQLVMFSVAGLGLSERERDGIKRKHLGGVILFAKNYRDRDQLSTLTDQIQSAARRGNRSRVGALISVDQEGGVVKRFPDMPPHYSHPRLGEINDESVAFDTGRATGRALKRAGVNVNLAPVADLDLAPSHVMRSRSFGSRRYRVARLARSFGKGLQRKSVAAAVKHFPGLGGATMNTDDGRAYVNRTRKQLSEVDGVPFQIASNAGLKLMMLSHAIYVHDGGERPASLSYRIATKRLRKTFGFGGVAISDALEPVAWAYGGNVPLTCKATFRAGVDIALITGGVDTAIRCADRIRRAVLAGKISGARLDRSVRRILRLKEWLGLVPS